MHIEPGVVEGSKILLSYGTVAVSIAIAVKHLKEAVDENGWLPLILRSGIASVLVFMFFELFPHYAVGVSEVHLILGTSLLLLFGIAPAAVGLMVGLLAQGVLFAAPDLPQYGMNVTTLLIPLFAANALARRIIPARTAYVDISYAQAFKLSLAYQGGIVVWVGFWAVYGNGFGAENLVQISSFGAAYLTVVLVEPLLDLALLAGAKSIHQFNGSMLVQRRVHNAQIS
ncbi:energy-coupling factor ABC transporter permease [Granulosicoccus antarcticus]|uniref:Cobalt transport protein CbiM n=1 Tax=Granulosicoccus antarcticus IMCC3135 TaxID=1192854 RepID=A0A2Z2NKA7_9GAMM|nr:energy-coupling factor ABC transporter permease [Granulosicoccus antarcticus]ASJ71832.1 hypothetical protein IMCC3135_08670 [Granulosicoccus antarcticus IMCC3135]